jgi:tRNA-splicing ligase RtcB
MPIKMTLNKGLIPIEVYTNDIDSASMDQLVNMSKLPIVHHHIAAMPDVHAGIGATVGAVIPTVGAIIPAAVGVDIGCFTGDTLIMNSYDDENDQIKDLVDNKKIFNVYAADFKGHACCTNATALKTRSQADLVQVTLNNGKVIRCTPDQRFLLKTGDWCAAEKLEPNMLLMSYRRTFVRLPEKELFREPDKFIRVVSVIPLEEKEDVYCLQVPGYLNFALEAGVFVHNCGMNAVRLSLKAEQLPDNLHRVRSAIEYSIPVGFEQHEHDPVKRSTIVALDSRLEQIVQKHPGILRKKTPAFQPWVRQLGTLGGGNHFIEICLDEANQVWIMLHSGSRNIGNVMGTYFINLAKKDMGKLLGTLPDKDLAYLTEKTEHFDDYVEAVHWAQDYALVNRREMMRLIIEAIKPILPPFELENEAVNCHHNYVSVEEHFGRSVYLTRKGAISAREGQLGIIPGSMGAKSYVVRGLGNAESFCSCSHGAGRRMSRHAAKRNFNTEDLEQQTVGVECRKDSGVLDEIPGAYKDIDQVMANQSDLVEILHTLKQVVCIKG